MVAQDEKYSVCHAPYLRNHTSYDFHLWYLDVSISSLFHYFNILIFRVVLGGGKGAKKNSPKLQKILSVARDISGTIHHIIVICGTQV